MGVLRSGISTGAGKTDRGCSAPPIPCLTQALMLSMKMLTTARSRTHDRRPKQFRLIYLEVFWVQKATRRLLVTGFSTAGESTRGRQKRGRRISGPVVGWLRRSGSRPTPLQWRRRELALDTSQAYHPCGVCATAIISQSSSLLPRRPTDRAKHTHIDAHIEKENEAETQAHQETEAACILVRCALCLCVRARHA